MGKKQSKHEEEVIINNNNGISSNVGFLQGRALGDFELILLVLAILVLGYLIMRKVKEYLMKTIRRQVVVQNV